MKKFILFTVLTLSILFITSNKVYGQILDDEEINVDGIVLPCNVGPDGECLLDPPSPLTYDIVMEGLHGAQSTTLQRDQGVSFNITPNYSGYYEIYVTYVSVYDPNGTHIRADLYSSNTNIGSFRPETSINEGTDYKKKYYIIEGDSADVDSLDATIPHRVKLLKNENYRLFVHNEDADVVVNMAANIDYVDDLSNESNPMTIFPDTPINGRIDYDGDVDYYYIDTSNILGNDYDSNLIRIDISNGKQAVYFDDLGNNFESKDGVIITSINKQSNGRLEISGATSGSYSLSITNDFSYVDRTININYYETYYDSIQDYQYGWVSERKTSHFYFRDPEEAKDFVFELNGKSLLDVVLGAGGIVTAVGSMKFLERTVAYYIGGYAGLALAVSTFSDIIVDYVNEQRVNDLANAGKMVFVLVVTEQVYGHLPTTSIIVGEWDGKTLYGGDGLVSENVKKL